MTWADGTTEITNSEDIIDSREVIARIAYLEGSRCEKSDPDGGLCEDPDCPDCGEDIAHELKALTELQSEAEGYAADWAYGETLIRDSYFTEYAQQLAEDIGAISSDASWPNDHIDWEAAADALKIDYTSVSFDGTDYWVRS